jgi:uncharacterized protein
MPTALELSRKELMPYVKALRRHKHPEPTAEQIFQREELIRRARKAAQILKEKYGATRVVLFGSLAHQEWFHSSTDVDIAVDGLVDGDYWKAWGDVEELFPGYRLDFVDWGMASESLQRTIDEEGVEL